MRYAYPAVIQVKISNIGCLDEVVGFILSKWRTTAINAISIGNYTVREVLMKNRTRVWRNVYNTASA